MCACVQGGARGWHLQRGIEPLKRHSSSASPRTLPRLRSQHRLVMETRPPTTEEFLGGAVLSGTGDDIGPRHYCHATVASAWRRSVARSAAKVVLAWLCFVRGWRCSLSRLSGVYPFSSRLPLPRRGDCTVCCRMCLAIGYSCGASFGRDVAVGVSSQESQRCATSRGARAHNPQARVPQPTMPNARSRVPLVGASRA